MPLYEYQCGACGTLFDVRRPFSQANDPAPCPECQSEQSKKKLSRVACFAKGGDGSSRAVGGGGG